MKSFAQRTVIFTFSLLLLKKKSITKLSDTTTNRDFGGFVYTCTKVIARQ